LDAVQQTRCSRGFRIVAQILDDVIPRNGSVVDGACFCDDVGGFGTSLGGGAYDLPMWVCKPRTRLIIQRYLTTWLDRVVLVRRYF
jgi:hypothetical protein